MRPTPPLFIVAGICLVIGGFVYDVMFAGIPYPDPTPELSIAYDRNAQIAAVLRWIGGGLLAAGCIWGIFRGSGRGPRDGRAAAWAWLWAILAVYVTCSLSAGAVMLGADICPDPGALTFGTILALPAIPAAGLLVAGLFLVSLVTTQFAVAIIGLGVLAVFIAVLVASGWMAMRGASEGRWPAGPTALFLLTLAGLSALSTVSFCGSLTA